MKKILLLSDSHGNIENMVKAVNTEHPDMILHMGDCWKDALRLRRRFLLIPMEMVIGNCDWNEGPAERILEIEGFKIMMCHGHAYGVKSSLLSLELAAKEKGADIVLFGHTHRVFYDRYDGLAIMNPGSIGAPPYGIPASYGILTLDKKTQSIKMQTVYLE